MLIVNLILLLMIKDMWCIRELCEFCYLWLKMLCDAYVNCVNFDFLGRELMIKETVLFWFFRQGVNDKRNCPMMSLLIESQITSPTWVSQLTITTLELQIKNVIIESQMLFVILMSQILYATQLSMLNS